MTRVINKLLKYINLNSDIKEIQRYEFKLKRAMQSIRDNTAKLHKVVIDEKELENILNFCTEQEFRVIQIRKSINNYTHKFTSVNTEKRNSSNKSRCSHTDHSVHSAQSTKHHILSNSNPSYIGKQNFGDNSNIKVRTPPKSLISHANSSSRLSYASSHFSDIGSSKKSSSDSHVFSPSYIAVLERRRTAKHGGLLVNQVEERTQIKLKVCRNLLIKKKKFRILG